MSSTMTRPPTVEATPLTGSLLRDLTASAGGPTCAVHFLGPRQLGSPLHAHRDQDRHHRRDRAPVRRRGRPDVGPALLQENGLVLP